MVDKALFIDSSAAYDSMRQLEILSNNLANLGTIGFRADHEVFKPITIGNDPKQVRVYSSLDKTFSNFEPGSSITTARDLDVAIAGPGFIAIQTKAGLEGYTRAGDLQLRSGFLTTRSGDFVKGSSGVIKIPNETERVIIGADGSVSAKVPGQIDFVTVNHIKLTNPPLEKLEKGIDGNFYLPEGETAKPDANIKLTPGTLESSNVNAIQTLTDLIELSRNFEFHTNLMKQFTDNAAKANQLLSL